jgi:hypothetical protein
MRFRASTLKTRRPALWSIKTQIKPAQMASLISCFRADASRTSDMFQRSASSTRCCIKWCKVVDAGEGLVSPNIREQRAELLLSGGFELGGRATPVWKHLSSDIILLFELATANINSLLAETIRSVLVIRSVEQLAEVIV